MNHFEHYLEVREIAGLATSTLETEKECHERLWSYLNGPENILEITRQNVLDYAEHLATSDLKPNTRRKLLGNLRAFYDYAVKENWIYQSPLNRIQLP